MSNLDAIALFSRSPSRPRRRLADDAETEKLMRERLIVARNLNSLDQKEAAAKLGYKNSSQLSKVENGEAPLPKSLLRKASLAYGVSADWLLGLSNEPERDPHIAGEMAVMRSVNAAVIEHTQNVTAVMLRIAGDQLPLEAHLRTLLDSARRATESFEKVCRMNSTFNDDIRGGASLQRDIDDLLEATVSVDQFLSRRANLTEIRKPEATMPLFDDQHD
ncbi:helix-turn-helix domain-containing protein [Paraburkholderia sp. SARCC-3016]|uniref:helix-turn-helix domain-containing protein n=1 Tax=Paraburkholderia sp. SARCC-3016 TaxID=3058611 RepID=UPI0028066DD9|nr:helix-turn-helix domain-containing protein [Paraburkholderia sp. SARCC-3016]MDQ7981888.1 helix-turn-helix domain-containing protein [Paraburkholderia sp. SARCC-3016]